MRLFVFSCRSPSRLRLHATQTSIRCRLASSGRRSRTRSRLTLRVGRYAVRIPPRSRRATNRLPCRGRGIGAHCARMPDAIPRWIPSPEPIARWRLPHIWDRILSTFQPDHRWMDAYPHERGRTPRYRCGLCTQAGSLGGCDIA